MAFAGACSEAGTLEANRDDDGVINESSDIGVFSLRDGDCVSVPDGEAEVDQLEAIPCEQPHNGEVIDVIQMAFGDDAAYPGEDPVFESASMQCAASFDRVTGLSFETDPDWNLYPLYPTSGSWESFNDREIVCIVTPLDGGTVSAPIRRR